MWVPYGLVESPGAGGTVSPLSVFWTKVDWSLTRDLPFVLDVLYPVLVFLETNLHVYTRVFLCPSVRV